MYAIMEVVHGDLCPATYESLDEAIADLDKIQNAFPEVADRYAVFELLPDGSVGAEVAPEKSL